MNRPQKHHYVPQMLLRRFANDRGMLWAYDKHTDRVFETGPDNVAGIRDFYTVSGEQPYIIERAFSHLEGRVAPVLERIRAEVSLASVSSDEREILDFFAALQMQRTVHPREVMTQLTEMLREKLARLGHDGPEIEDFASGGVDEADARAQELLASAIASTVHFANKDLLILEWGGESAKFIGDNPIAKQNHRSFGLYGNLGIAQPGIEIYLPISASLTLNWMCPSFRESMASTAETAQRIGNEDESLRERVAALSQRPTMFLKAVETGVAYPIEPANLENLNALQVRFSERFVFAQADDFELIRRMLRDHADYRKGPRLTF